MLFKGERQPLKGGMLDSRCSTSEFVYGMPSFYSTCQRAAGLFFERLAIPSRSEIESCLQCVLCLVFSCASF